MSNEVEALPKLEPISIIITSFNRRNLLEKTVNYINERTFYPYRIFVVDSNSDDGTVGMLKEMKVQGRIFDLLLLPNNLGQSKALNKAFDLVEWWEKEHRRPSSDFFITTNDDIYPPMLGQENCWLRRMLNILKENEPDYGGICMRIQRTARNQIDETKDIIPCYKGFPSVFRLMRRSDIRKLGDNPFGRLLKWDSNTCGEKFKTQICKKFGFATHIYADHAGFMTENRGYAKDFKDYHTYAANKEKMNEEKPYPDIDPATNVPIKINHPCDAEEQRKREEKTVSPEVTVIVLTCKRYDGLLRIINSIKKYTANVLYELLVVVDNDDTEAYEYCIENNIKCILSGFHRDFVAQANLAAYACETPFFVTLGDDTEVDDPEWLNRAMFVFKGKFPDRVGLLAFNDGIQNGKLYTMGMTSKKFVNAIGGNLHYPGYKHYGSDREISNLAREMGCYHYDPAVRVLHHHWQSKKEVEKDETYSRSEKFWKQDQDLKHHRQRNVNLLEKKNSYDYTEVNGRS